MVASLTALLSIGLICGCGDNLRAACPNRGLEAAVLTENCQAALGFVARDTRALVATQTEVSRYYERWSSAVNVESILEARVPQRHRVDYGRVIPIYTRNAAIIASWNSGLLETGVRDFDAAVQELAPVQISPYGGHDNGDGSFLFSLDVDVLFNEELLANRLATSDSWLVDPVQHPRDDGIWHWRTAGLGTGNDSDTAEIDFTFGWGDCAVACDGFHTLRAVVPPSDEAVVYDVGGDPLPEGLVLDSRTQPLPR